MNPTTLTLAGALVAFAGVLATAVVAFVGKRGELSLSGLNSLTDQLQEERSSMKQELADKKQELADRSAELNAALAQESARRATAEAESARLRGIIVQLGGDPG
ncbi:hypothetical protein OH809_45155 (plasmid) [Streptomyces sp. NBC_00873]|uniref:hypothetical protein n=1 Tax=Streptomyces sp. NBC_00873 TaxID=2975852 RepID=UPI0037DCCE40|nr:hypothetical protein OH809_45155 [Streptomyces sp. NBC_00873]